MKREKRGPGLFYSPFPNFRAEDASLLTAVVLHLVSESVAELRKVRRIPM